MDPTNRDRIKADALKWVIAMQCDRAYELLEIVFEKLRRQEPGGLMALLGDALRERHPQASEATRIALGFYTCQCEAIPQTLSPVWIGEWGWLRAVMALADVAEPRAMTPDEYQALLDHAAVDPRGAWERFKKMHAENKERSADTRTPAQVRAIVADLERSLDPIHTMYVVNRAMLDLRAQSRSLVPRVP
jgi:hypothetical protein